MTRTQDGFDDRFAAQDKLNLETAKLLGQLESGQINNLDYIQSLSRKCDKHAAELRKEMSDHYEAHKTADEKAATVKRSGYEFNLTTLIGLVIFAFQVLTYVFPKSDGKVLSSYNDTTRGLNEKPDRRSADRLRHAPRERADNP